VWPVLVLAGIVVRKVVMKDVFHVRFFQLETANFIQMILTHILLLFAAVKNSHLDVVCADRPNVKVLNVPELVDKNGRFANLNFSVFI
jgi:hypothetical protein